MKEDDPGEQVMTFTPSFPDKLGTANSSDSGAPDAHKTEPALMRCCVRAGPGVGAGAGAGTCPPGSCRAHSARPELPFVK